MVTIAATVLALLLWFPGRSIAGGAPRQVCDVRADYFLGIEDYSEAIGLHIEVVREQPNNALAHYHLGFALGMAGDRTAEVSEYQRAEDLGLKNWDLFLNLGLAQLEYGDLNGATDSMQRAVLLGRDYPESHFNLALVYERRGMLADAEHEAMASLLLNPDQADARNLLGVIYARRGESVRASRLWSELVRDMPDYGPARENLTILGSQNAAANGKTVAVSPLTPAAAVKAFSDESELKLP